MQLVPSSYSRKKSKRMEQYKYAKFEKGRDMALGGLWGIISDIHIPWHSQRSVDLAMTVFEDQGVTGILLGGDIGDFARIQMHGANHPEIQKTLQMEIDAIIDFLIELRKRFPGVRIVYCEGNHEDRLSRFIMSQCPVFWNMVSLKKRIEAENLDIEWHPYNERFWFDDANIFFQHSPKSYSVNAARTNYLAMPDCSAIYGCTHRPDQAHFPGSKEYYSVTMLGWHGDRGHFDQNKKEISENRRVFAYTKNHEKWGRSIALLTIDGKSHHLQHVLFKDYTCAVGGVIYEA